MKPLEQEKLTKPKLKFTLTGSWMYEYSFNFPQTQYATVDLRDETSNDFYKKWHHNYVISNSAADNKACYIAIGIKRS